MRQLFSGGQSLVPGVGTAGLHAGAGCSHCPAIGHGRAGDCGGRFFLGTYSTALDEGEMIIAMEIPAIAVNQHQRFLEIYRRSGDCAISGGAFVLKMDAGMITVARLTFLPLAIVLSWQAVRLFWAAWAG